MTDPFARTVARNAHTTITLALHRIEALEQHVRRIERTRPHLFAGRCTLCGQPSGRRRYCHAHRWAE